MLGKNFRYIAFKYKIKCSYWYTNWSYINSCISDFVSNSYNQDVIIVWCTIRELCISRGEEHCLFNMYEQEEFIEFLSTKCFMYMYICYCYVCLYLFFNVYFMYLL